MGCFVEDPVGDKVLPFVEDFVVFMEDESDGRGKLAGFGGGDGGFVDGGNGIGGTRLLELESKRFATFKRFVG